MTSDVHTRPRRWPVEEYNRRFMARLRTRTVVNDQGCFVWQGPVGTKGYGISCHRDHPGAIHRAVYKVTHGVQLAEEQFVCHTCDCRRCWNPDHLFIGTAKDNNRDCGNKGRHHNFVKTHCKRGHEFTPENTNLKVTPTTVMRSCLKCEEIRRNWPRYKDKARENQRRRNAAKRAAKNGETHV